MLSVRDVWYHVDTLYTDADVVYYMQMDKPIGNDWYEQFTILNDLTLNEEALLGNINATGRNEIRSIRSNAEYTYHMEHEGLTSATLNKFIEEYNRFAAIKKLVPADVRRLYAYNKEGMLAISWVNNTANKTISWHAYRVNTERVFLISSFTMVHQADNQNKNETGSVNRFCHFADMLYFKQNGVQLYDWGGWYNGKEDSGLLNINSFKEKFGGVITPNYNSTVYVSLKGKLFWLIKKISSKN